MAACASWSVVTVRVRVLLSAMLFMFGTFLSAGGTIGGLGDLGVSSQLTPVSIRGEHPKVRSDSLPC